MYRMTESEKKLAALIWENEPIASSNLVKLCEEHFTWKKSTTYTVLKKLCNEEIFINKDTVVKSLLTEAEYNRLLGEQFLEDNYNGSLPSFIAAFADHKKLSRKQISEIRQIIDSYQK